MKKFNSFKQILESNSISTMSKKELQFISGGTDPFIGEGGGSQTSGTAGNPTPCDKTCVCKCEPK